MPRVPSPPLDPDSTDISAELAWLKGAIAAAPDPAEAQRARLAVASAALIPAVIGAIAVGATAHEPPGHEPPPAAPAVPSPAPAHEAHVIVPIHRTPVLPLTPEHKPLPPGVTAPDLAFHPRFKAMVASQRGLTVATGRSSAATLYQVAPGDSLYAIAKALLGNGTRWREIYAANRDRLTSPSLIRTGMTLRVPAGAAASPRASHHVALGDTLYDIAAKRLHDPSRWREIAALNKARLRGGTTIYPHQVLRLPAV